MIHKVMPFGETAAPRINYALGGDHEHKVEGIEFIPGTMLSEPIPLGRDEPMPEEMQTLNDIIRSISERNATADTFAATGGNSDATDGTNAANAPQDGKQPRKKNKPLAYDWSDLNDEFEATASFHQGKGEKLFGHYIISLAPGETLTNEQWGDVLKEYMDALGYDEFTKYCGFIHNDTQNQHCHILSSRVRLEPGGPLVDDSNDCAKGMECMRKLEKKYGLQIVANPEESWGKEIPKGEFKYLGGDRETVLKNKLEGPNKDWAEIIRARVKETWNTAKPRDMAEMVESLKAHGVDIKIRTNKAGEPEGISYRAHGSDAWISGSKVLAKRLTWQNLIGREGIAYHPAKHNEALGIPVPAGVGYVRTDVYQPLNKIQVRAIMRTKLRVRIYERRGVHYAGFGFDNLFKTGKQRHDEKMARLYAELAKAIVEMLFGVRYGRAAPPIVTTDGQRPEGMKPIRDDVGNSGYDIEAGEAGAMDWKQAKSLKKDLSSAIMNEHSEWISPRIERKASTLDNDMELDQ